LRLSYSALLLMVKSGTSLPSWISYSAKSGLFSTPLGRKSADELAPS
jgi:hypothetical protein